MKRRTFLTGMGGLATVGMTGHLVAEWHERGWRTPVATVRAASYEVDLEDRIRGGLRELGFGPAQMRGKSILLKPNLVEPYADAPQINTHPAVVRAAAEVFRTWVARGLRCRGTRSLPRCSTGPGTIQDGYHLDGVPARVR